MEMTELYVGVDIGNKGAFCVMTEHKEILEVFRMPTFPHKFGKTKKAKTSNFVDTDEVFEKLKKYCEQGYELTFAVEIIRVGRSPYGSLNMGISYGRLWECLSYLGKIQFYAPSSWMKSLIKEYKMDIDKADVSDLKEDSKTPQIALTRHYFGNDILLPTKRSKVPHDGIADAIWLADHLRRETNA